MTVLAIPPRQLAELYQSSAVPEVIDVRTPMGFREIPLASARNIPLERLDPHAVRADRNGSRDEPLSLVCRSGSRGRQMEVGS